MRVLVACEYSGIVRSAFEKRGHDAISCDLLDTEIPGPHYKGPVENILSHYKWDMIIAHPPCTYLTVSGNRWYSDRPDLYEPAAEFAVQFFDYADKVCVENPVGRLSSLFRPPDQYIQPYQFGHAEKKKTGLWLKGLTKLEPTKIITENIQERVWKMGPSPNRQKERSRFFEGIAEAMAAQWG